MSPTARAGITPAGTDTPALKGTYVALADAEADELLDESPVPPPVRFAPLGYEGIRSAQSMDR